MRKIGHFFLSVCTGLGIVVLVMMAGGLVMRFYGTKQVNVPEHTMLMVDFGNSFSENTSLSVLDELLGRKNMAFSDLITAVQMAEKDERIDGLTAYINTTSLDLGQIQDVARVVQSFRNSGKKTVVFSQGFGPLGQGNREYYLASFFEKIYMQPHTNIGITGINIEIPFVRDLMDKFGITAEFYTRYEYKTAMVSFTDNKISAEYKAEMQKLTDSLMNTLKGGINENRKLNKNIDELINLAPITAEDGIKYGLIDDLMYLPQLEKRLKDDGVENFVHIEDYATLIRSNEGNLPTVAWINLSGMIESGEGSNNLNGEMVIGSRSLLNELAKIGDIPNLKALVVRINSPGGDYNAADEIYFALKQLKSEKNIPIIISQGGYAASGGYFISLAGDVIIAEPATITGSIGVLGGKFAVQNLWKKLGVNWAEIKNGENADILSVNKPFSESERKIFNRQLDAVYDDFTAKVAENRKLTQPMDKIARGRVWTGAQAVELGLVDKLGGYNEALGEALAAANIGIKDKFKLLYFPKEKNFTEKLRDILLQIRINTQQLLIDSGVDRSYLKLFKRWQYDTVLVPFMINM